MTTLRTAPRCVVLTRRRTGARSIFRLLGNYLPNTNLGGEPFHWSRRMGGISRSFFEGRRDEARAMLADYLGYGLYFKHQVETESREFNLMLFGELAKAGYRVVWVDRRDEVKRLFSVVVATHYNAWDRDAIAALRERLKAGEAVPAPDPAAIPKLVAGERAYLEWFEAQYPEFGLPTCRVAFEDFYEDGIGVLARADEVFGFAGLGDRGAVLSDESLLRHAFSGGHHSQALLEYSAQLREIHARLGEGVADGERTFTST